MLKRIKHIKNVICPFHHDTHPSLSIYEIDGKYYFRCFGCEKKGSLQKENIFRDLIDAIETYDISYVNNKFKHVENIDTEFLQYVNQKYRIDVILMKEYGIKHDSDNWILYIPLYDANGKIWGRQLKYEKRKDNQPKYHLSAFRKGIYASIFYQNKLKAERFFITESVLDGLSLLSLTPEFDDNCNELAFISILGTKLHDSVIYEFIMCHPEAIYTISFDADAKAIAFLYAHHLRMLGIKVDLFLPEDNKKVYDTKTFQHVTF